LNDSLGHTVGDHILQHVATRIREALNDEDIVARLGGDEFALILRHCASNTEAEERIARIEDALSELIPLGRDSRRVSASSA
jgi:diguanylate cyclase (GGDEF)-like protein